jgi:hypothetical protein
VILTKRGWGRARHERRVEQRRVLQSMPPSFSCSCIQDYCGGMEVVAACGVVFCRTCGRPREIVRLGRKPSDPREYVKPEHQQHCHRRRALLARLED